MDLFSAAQFVLFIVIVTVLVKPLGGYVERVFSGKRTALDWFCLPVERLIYRITGVDPVAEMTFAQYATCFVLFGLFGTLLLYAILRLQRFLPWSFSDYQTTPLSPDLTLNTAISFSTTTTWQAYGGENTMSYFSQMVGLCAQNFLAGERTPYPVMAMTRNYCCLGRIRYPRIGPPLVCFRFCGQPKAPRAI